MNFLSGLTGSNSNKKNVGETEGMMATPNASASMMGGRRRKSRRASRKAGKKSRKASRKGSKKSRKGSKKSRKASRKDSKKSSRRARKGSRRH